MFDYLLPKAAEVEAIAEALQLQQAAQEFRMEVERRQAQANYCQWYHDMARQTQADAAAMENDPNVFGWFCGLKRQPSSKSRH
ncbi:MAG: hypothetical protein HC800_12630 [Phormidesmis sp. RL_2_1]|nr:hypothetical protein [Phormidesmis sp. RL_2_1]